MKHFLPILMLLWLGTLGLEADDYSVNDAFMFTVQTNLPGASADNQFSIPTYGDSVYNYSVDCDRNGFFDATGVTGDYTCSYPEDNNATPRVIAIVGTFPRIYFNNSGDKAKILSVDRWGVQQWRSMNSAFKGCTNLEYVPDSDFNLSQVTDFSFMFAGTTSFNAPIGSWDMSHAENTTGMFLHAELFNQDIGDWNLSNDRNMSAMFEGASVFNKDIGSWDVSNVEDTAYMFAAAGTFNQDIGRWNVSNDRNMSAMFYEADVFNQDLGNWDVSHVTDMSRMFQMALGFYQDISRWDVGSTKDLEYMFFIAFMSVSDYDALLLHWQNLSLPNDVLFPIDAHYCSALLARNRIISEFNWTLYDVGQNCDFYINTSYDITVRSGATQKVADLGVVSVGADPVSYSIVGGSDASMFFLSTTNGGVLNINSVDAHYPMDSNSDNIYRVRIKAMSGSYSDERTINVRVSDTAAMVPVIMYLLN